MIKEEGIGQTIPLRRGVKVGKNRSLNGKIDTVKDKGRENEKEEKNEE